VTTSNERTDSVQTGNPGAVPSDDPEAIGAFETLVRHAHNKAAADEKARKARDQLDEAIALRVTSEPTSEVWYAHPGTLTIDQVIAAVGGGPTGVHRAMERYRKAHPKKGGRR
jgi:hypothetical protein